MSFFPDFEKIRENNRKAGEHAAMMNPVSTLHPEVGRHYTISPSFAHGDRSYTREILFVEALNDAHALVRLQRPFCNTTHVLINIDEHYWYDAETLAAAMPSEAQP